MVRTRARINSSNGVAISNNTDTLPHTAMIIGFTERRRTVSEGGALPGLDIFPLPIPLATLRTAEREHPMNIRLFGSSAIVEPIG